MAAPEVTSTFHHPCLKCGLAIDVVDGVQQSHPCAPLKDLGSALARAYWAGHDRALRDKANDV